MLINISEGFLVGLTDVGDAFVEKFEELIFQHVRSFHYVSSTRKVAKEIAKILDDRLSQKSKNALIQISSQSDSSLALLKKMKFYMEIRHCGTDSLVIEKNSDVQIWVCCIAYASQWCSHPVKIIGENISDGKACLEAGRHFSIINSYPDRMQRATLEMSGGCGDADTVLDQRLSDALAPVLCFVDSDKLCQNHEGSPAIKKCSELIEKKSGIAVFYYTKTRELENILPFKYIKLAVEELDTSFSRDSILDNLIDLKKIRDTSPNLYSYIDLKLGTCSNWVSRQTLDTISHYKMAKKIKPCSCGNECEGLISPPVMKIILDKVIDRMKTGSPKEIKTYVNDVDDSDWLNFGEIVFSMTVANIIRLT